MAHISNDTTTTACTTLVEIQSSKNDNPAAMTQTATSPTKVEKQRNVNHDAASASPGATSPAEVDQQLNNDTPANAKKPKKNKNKKNKKKSRVDNDTAAVLESTSDCTSNSEDADKVAAEQETTSSTETKYPAIATQEVVMFPLDALNEVAKLKPKRIPKPPKPGAPLLVVNNRNRKKVKNHKPVEKVQHGSKSTVSRELKRKADQIRKAKDDKARSEIGNSNLTSDDYQTSTEGYNSSPTSDGEQTPSEGDNSSSPSYGSLVAEDASSRPSLEESSPQTGSVSDGEIGAQEDTASDADRQVNIIDMLQQAVDTDSSHDRTVVDSYTSVGEDIQAPVQGESDEKLVSVTDETMSDGRILIDAEANIPNTDSEEPETAEVINTPTSPAGLLALPNLEQHIFVLPREKQEELIKMHVVPLSVIATPIKSKKAPRNTKSTLHLTKAAKVALSKKEFFEDLSALPAPLLVKEESIEAPSNMETSLPSFPQAVQAFNEPANTWLTVQKDNFDASMATEAHTLATPEPLCPVDAVETESPPEADVHHDHLTYAMRHTFLGTASLEDFIEKLEDNGNDMTNKKNISVAFDALSVEENQMLGMNNIPLASQDMAKDFNSPIVQCRTKLGRASLFAFLKEIHFDGDGNASVHNVANVFCRLSQDNGRPSSKLANFLRLEAASRG